MPSVRLLLLLAAVVVLQVLAEDDFAFDVADDFEIEFDGERKLWNREYTAVVGRVFYLKVPSEGSTSFEAKRKGGNGLPVWLLFDKKSGVFWGVPLEEDVGTIELTVRTINNKSAAEEVVIKVVESNEDISTVEKCPPNEDSTVLTLLIDKNTRAIKPKQRVVAVNNIAKFFGLPYSAFTLKPEVKNDDIADSSVVLAGPGNLHARTSKTSSLLQVPVGCDGRLWVAMAPIIHQLKQQARDGTIAEVLRLPLIGWRVKTETRPVVREKRQINEGDYANYGKIESSGDYGEDDDYYDEEYDYEDEDLGDIEKVPPTTKPAVTKSTTLKEPSTTTTTTTTTTQKSVETHPHRHHHGEVKNTGEEEPSIPVISSTPSVPVTKETTTTTTSTTPKPELSTTPVTPTLSIDIDSNKPKAIPETVPNYEDEEYDYPTFDDEDEDEGPIEAVTIVPDMGRKQTVPPSIEDTESITTEAFTVKTTVKEVPVPETDIPTSSATTSTSTAPSSTTSKVTIAAPTTTTTTTEAPTTFEIIEETEPPIYYSTAETTTVIPSTVSTVSLPESSPTVAPTTVPTTTTITTSTVSTTTTTTPKVTEPITAEEETTVKLTTVRQVSTPASTTTVKEDDDDEFKRIMMPEKNYKPYIENRLQPMVVTAGKIFRFVVPKNIFKDAEDGYNLTLQCLDSNEKPITKNSWLQFNPVRREVYGLPLEEDVSKWVYIIRAVDSKGAYEQDQLEIRVQQHKLESVINHEFSLHIRIEKPQEFPHYVDWSLKVLRALGKIYGTNMSEITVRHVNHTNEPAVFTWSNDTVPTDYCPKAEIEQLYKILTANDRGDPSQQLNVALAPELRVKKVLYREFGVCETPATPETPQKNFAPFLRNPIDQINATVGELLVYKVKDDTFYDPEDVDPSMLNITLVTSERQPIPANNWLQFDSKNREFYGIPWKGGISQYQLICTDSGGLFATDSLVVVVSQPPKIPYNYEFTMVIEENYESFANSAPKQKNFVEKLVRLFEDPTHTNFRFLPFRKKDDLSLDSTVITWFNKTLPTDKCPTEETNRLESVLRNSDLRINSKVHRIMGPEFKVSVIKIRPLGNCNKKQVVAPTVETTQTEENQAASGGDDYMFTFIVPAIIISIMLFAAALAAFLLYRRRRTGKMNVEEDGRQSYGNKGIPVIFQEELEEKPEPGTKAPVILKDEKPPLAPPEYSKSGSVNMDDSEPYQPPPPFTRTQDNNKQRPKPTPTYRKPPPYVPP